MDYRIRGKRDVTITQYGEAWVDAEDEAEARKLAEDDPESLDWDWDDLDPEEGLTIEIIGVEGEADEAEEEEEEL